MSVDMDWISHVSLGDHVYTTGMDIFLFQKFSVNFSSTKGT